MHIGGQAFDKMVFECGGPDARPGSMTGVGGVVWAGPDGLHCVPADSQANVGVRACGPDRRCYVPPAGE